MPLSDLIDTAPEILTRWPSEPLLFKREPGSFAHLLTLAEVNALVDTHCLAARNVVLLKDGEIIERHTYVTGDAPRPGAVRAHLDRGGTVTLRDLQALKPAVSRLCDEIRQETGCRVHINAYMTPPGSQGLTYHYDPYVTLILQVAGRKAWPLHPPIVENPTGEYGAFEGRGFTHDERKRLATTPPARTVTLEPGDVFWLPRGYLHAPYTVGDTTSLHLTVAIKERTRHWLAERVVTEILAQALVDPALRAQIPPAELLDDPVPAIERARTYLVGALLSLPPEDMKEPVRRTAKGVA
ncbi:cupin domain-containing protein [Streptomyces sp. CC208A]|uniref:JmjC domain-containing protein n=1 Tax=Streptomyces sp. CC208A TaxID=3044573 RepID=UPI0024A8D688|nr:cupin domain-containing protein [Streptomyces sp. CC208A]